jgi:hypothetical protein
MLLYQHANGVDGGELPLHRDTAPQPHPRLFQKETRHPLQRKGVSMGDTQQRSRQSSYTGRVKRLKWASGTSSVPSWTQRSRSLWLILRSDAMCQSTPQLVFLLADQATVE